MYDVELFSRGSTEGRLSDEGSQEMPDKVEGVWSVTETRSSPLLG